MKTAGFALLASMILVVGVDTASAQPGDPNHRPGYAGHGAPAPGISPYGGPSRGPVPMMRPGSASPYHSQPVPSTRFAPVPESTRRSAPPAGPSYRSSGANQYRSAPGYSSSPASPRQPSDSGRVPSRAEDLQRMSPEMKAEDRLKVPLLKSMYRQGNDMLDEGRNSGDESKIKMGIQQINEANERVNRLEREYGPGRGQGSDRGGERDARGNNGRSNARRDRR